MATIYAMAGAIMTFARNSARSRIPVFTGAPSPAPAFVPGVMTGSGRAAFPCRRCGTAGHLDGGRADTISRFPRGTRLFAGVSRSLLFPEAPWFDPRARAPIEELDVLFLHRELAGLAGRDAQIHRRRDVDDHLLVGERVPHRPHTQRIHPQLLHPVDLE